MASLVASLTRVGEVLAAPLGVTIWSRLWERSDLDFEGPILQVGRAPAINSPTLGLDFAAQA